MKKLTLLFGLAFMIQSISFSQPCLPEGIIFTSQTQIDSFQIIHPNCTEIEGDVEINGLDIANLNGLNVITSIGGYLNIGWTDGTSLIDLSGLDSLTTIGGELLIWTNSDLTSLSGLDNLTTIGGKLKIGSNNMLPNLSGLDNLTSIGGELFIKWSPALLNLAGLAVIIRSPPIEAKLSSADIFVRFELTPT